MRITDTEFVSFDLETTGLDTKNDRVVEFGATIFHGREVSQRGHVLINPEMKISEEARKVHKISNDTVANSKVFKQVAARLVDKFKDTPLLIGYNCIRFDAPMLDAEFERAGVDFRMPMDRILDVMTWVNWYHRGRRGRRQEQIGPEVYEINFDGSAHSAAADTQMTGQILLAMIDEGIVPDDVDEALAWQAEKREIIEQEYTDWGPWLFRDRTTQRIRIGAGKHCGKLISEVGKNTFGWYLENIDDLPAPARAAFEAAKAGRTQDEIQESLFAATASSSSKDDDDDVAGWGG
jgi:DNA polymerase III epsilon subunit family exonuclease